MNEAIDWVEELPDIDSEFMQPEWEESEVRRGGRGGRGRPSRPRQPTGRQRRIAPPSRRPGRGGALPRRPRAPRRPGIRPRPSRYLPREPLCTCPAQDCPQHGSEYVRWVQSSLNQIQGLNLPVNGIMDAATRSALHRFQEQQGLAVDGIAGPETKQALMTSRSGTADQNEGTSESEAFDSFDLENEILESEINRSSRGYIRWVQQALNTILGLRLAVDGILGSQTRSAIRDFQKRHGLAVDGIVGKQTEAALIAAGAGHPSANSSVAPGLPATARRPSARGAALGAIQAAARQHGLGEVFVSVVSHLAQTESGATYARPANTFDARPPAERPPGKALITAWGVFQFNRDAWRSLPGTSSTSFPWEASAAEEINRPVARYAELFRQVRAAGGSELAAARGIRLWHRSPAAYRNYLRAGQDSGFEAAWRAVPQRHRTAVDRRMRETGLIGNGSDHEMSMIEEILWQPAWRSGDDQLHAEVSMIILSDSVGNGGANKPYDVTAVQNLLNKFILAGKLPGIAPLTVDGKSGPRTRAAIRAFQRIVVGMNYPDGRVDPGGRTLQALNGPIVQPSTPATPTVTPPSSSALQHGVPGGRIFSGYLKRRSSGYHLGIDVSTSNAAGQGAHDPRRGLPVYATVKTALDIATLNKVQAASKKEPPWQQGLKIPGHGRASLREAQVYLRETKDLNNPGYGGSVGLACRYTYTTTHGQAAVFTIYIEYLHLITPGCLPYDGKRLISLAEWNAAGKGDRIGFGPRMKHGAILKASDLATLPLIGYLGATRWPHVHIQAEYKQGVHSYLFYPRHGSLRLDPAAVIH